MRKTEILCYQCVYPYALDFCRSRVAPPSRVAGDIADHDLLCTKCGSGIPTGQGYVRLKGDEPETTPAPVGGDGGISASH